MLGKRKVEFLDIWSPDDPATKDDPSLDTTKFRSERAGRSPLVEGWQKTCAPLMCCYKLVTIKFAVFGLQGKVESVLDSFQRDFLLRFFKQVFCLMDNWFGMTMEDIRAYEEKTKQELDQKIAGLALETKAPVDASKIKPAEPVLEEDSTSNSQIESSVDKKPAMA